MGHSARVADDAKAALATWERWVAKIKDHALDAYSRRYLTGER